MAAAHAQRHAWLDVDDLAQAAYIGFCRGWDEFDVARCPSRAGYACWKARKGILSAVRCEARWWALKSRLQLRKPGWATWIERPRAELRLDMQRTDQWERFTDRRSEGAEVELSAWQQGAMALFSRGW